MAELDLARRMEDLGDDLESIRAWAGDAVTERVRRMMATVLDFHAAGLGQLLRILENDPSLAATCQSDPLVNSLLVLHGLLPGSLISLPMVGPQPAETVR